MAVSINNTALGASVDNQAAWYLHGLRRTVAGGLMRVARMLHQAHMRRRLAYVDDAVLADLGISRSQATFEASRRFWDSTQPPGN